MSASAPFEYRLALPWDIRRAALVPEPVPAPVRMNGKIVGHHDADSIYAELDFGVFGLHVRKQLFRVLGVACRELGEPGGNEARDALKIRLGMTLGSPVVLTFIKPDKYGGRLDAVVTYRGQHGLSRDLATELIADGWGVPWDGKGEQPKPLWPRPEPVTP